VRQERKDQNLAAQKDRRSESEMGITFQLNDSAVVDLASDILFQTVSSADESEGHTSKNGKV